MPRRAVAILVVLLGLGWVLPTGAGAANLPAARVRLTPVATGLDRPVAAAWRPGDPRMYVAEQTGRIAKVQNAQRRGNALRIAVSQGGERGLLGLAFSRDGQKLYTDYTDPHGDTHVDEFAWKGTHAPAKTRRQILFQPQPFANHNGGEVTIGPDNMLYIALGDGGGAGDPFNNAQRGNSLLGKILRVDPRPLGAAPYRIPADNPFVGVPGARGEIWMYGLRNPWRWSFDRASGDIWIGDVGQSAYEEIDYAPAHSSGINWGWRPREGFHAYAGAAPPGARDPVIERPHTAGDCAITGGYVYRGAAIPALAGAYVYGDFCTGHVYAAVQQGGAIVASRDLGIQVPSLSSFAEDPSGELYAISLGGTIYKLTSG